MSNVYTGYFQKSKVFLFPLIGFTKVAHYVPIKTYVIWDGVCDINDRNIICVYKNDGSYKYKSFEDKVLMLHGNRVESKLSEDQSIHVYNLNDFANDYDNFVKGKYSNFSIEAKEKIISYFRTSKISNYVDSYLNPENYHEEYSENLGIPLKDLQEVYELCSKPDFEKETLKT